MFKKIFWFFIAFAFPWVVMILDDNPGAAIIALVMQATIIGWIPATIWAMNVMNAKNKQAVPKKPPSENIEKK